MAGFEELEVWKAGRKTRLFVKDLCKKFPKNEEYLLISQLKRASRSITANIAEGHGRFHYKENIQFCRTSRGSLEETKDHLITALDEQLIDEKDYKDFLILYENNLKLINGYIAWLKKQIETTKLTNN